MEQKNKDLVCEIIEDQLGHDRQQIDDSFDFAENGADSLDAIELVMAFEEEFDIEIPDGDFEKVKTFGDLIQLLEKQGVS